MVRMFSSILDPHPLDAQSTSQVFFPPIIYLFIYFGLCWVFVATPTLSLAAVSGTTLYWGAWASLSGGFSCWGA